MIRRILIHRWQARMPKGEDGEPMLGACAIASFWTLRHWLWIDRYNAWHVARWGERPGGEPFWLRPVSRFVTFVDDWRLAVSMRQGWPSEARRLSEPDHEAAA